MRIMEITARLGGVQVLDPKLRSDLDRVEIVREGLPTAAVVAIVQGGTLSSREVEDRVIPRRTLAHRRQTKQRISPEESERLVRIARISALADEAFQNPEKAARWLLATGAGARPVEGMRGQIARGIFT